MAADMSIGDCIDCFFSFGARLHCFGILCTDGKVTGHSTGMSTKDMVMLTVPISLA